MKTIINRAQEAQIIEALRSALDVSGYVIHLNDKVLIRVNGVADGELFMSMSCHVYRMKKDPTDAK
jgi:hypothetical protein